MLHFVKNILGPKAPGFPIFIGLIFAVLYPYFALPINSFTIYFLFLLMFLSVLQLKDFKFRLSKIEAYSLIVGLFFCFCFLPAVTWLLGHFLIKDDILLYGVFWSTLCPVAIVAPFFVKRMAGNDEFSFKFVVASTITFPIFAVIMIPLFNPHLETINLKPFLIDILALVSLPVLAALFINSWIKKTHVVLEKVRSASPAVCMVLIGLLAYIIAGTARLRINVSLVSNNDWVFLALLAVAQDFLTYFSLPFLLSKLIPDSDLESLRISLSMKNVVVAGSILGFYLPKAALPAVLVLLVHACFFGFLLAKTKR